MFLALAFLAGTAWGNAQPAEQAEVVLRHNLEGAKARQAGPVVPVAVSFQNSPRQAQSPDVARQGPRGHDYSCCQRRFSLAEREDGKGTLKLVGFFVGFLVGGLVLGAAFGIPALAMVGSLLGAALGLYLGHCADNEIRKINCAGRDGKRET